jgi:hypothetical protein
MIHAYEKIESLPPGTVATDSNTSHDAYALWATMRMFHEANAATIDESIILRDVAKRESRHEVSVNVSAVADMVVIGGCFPGVSLNQEIGVLRAYLEVHPEELDKPAFRVMARAFTRAYPCSSRAPSLVP